jgi:hypothetical protein
VQVRVEEDLKREIVSHSDAMDIVVREVREVKRRSLTCAVDRFRRGQGEGVGDRADAAALTDDDRV